MRAFRTWTEAHDFACTEATALNLPHGIGKCKLTGEYTVRILPGNPDGTESRLERVLPGTPKTATAWKDAISRNHAACQHFARNARRES